MSHEDLEFFLSMLTERNGPINLHVCIIFLVNNIEIRDYVFIKDEIFKNRNFAISDNFLFVFRLVLKKSKLRLTCHYNMILLNDK